MTPSLDLPCRTHKPCHQGSKPTVLALFTFWTLFTHVRTQGGFSLNQACERTLGDGTVEYLACSSSSEALSQLDVSVSVNPVNSTCGLSADQNRMIYSTLGYNIFSICDANNATFAHPPELIADAHDRDNPTWWQSISWYDYPIPLEVEITLSLDHSYTLVDNIDVTFQSGRPKRMILEKSNDNGATWETLQFYSTECQDDFTLDDLSESEISNESEVICTSDYSGTVPYTDGEVMYSVNNRLELFFMDEDVTEQRESAFIDLITLTDLRLRLLSPATDGLEITGQKLALTKYYYAISNIESYLTCNCNLHGRFCIASASGIGVECECFHNTMGPSCEQCLPLYNNRPWRAGSFTPYPSGTANECQECTCNGHADSCVYNTTLGYGVCVGCYDNTVGDFCSICVEGFYRNESRELNHPDVCTECDCEPRGTLDNRTVCARSPDDVTGAPIGQCPCKANVTGRACDQCEEGYYGLLTGPALGQCQECGCNELGTVNASVSCDQTSGQCICKANTDTQFCGECRDQFYGFPTDADMDCTSCGCDPGASESLNCNKVTGRCDCRGFIGGQQCQDVESGYYFPYLDFNGYDAWEADSACMRQSDFPSDQFSGRGYQVCGVAETVVFQGIAAYSNVSESMLNFIAIRYTYESVSPWLMVALTVTAESNQTSALSCPDPPGSTLESFAFSMSPGVNEAWTSDTSVAFHHDCLYTATLQMDNPGLGADTITIDSLLLLPDPSQFTVYAVTDTDQQIFYETCVDTAASLATRSAAVESCQGFTFSLSLEMAGAALECTCDPTGSLQTLCAAYGGACLCKPGVGGQNCERCQPGFFNFTSEGCQACNCDGDGSMTQACDFVTGQCPCKEGVALDNQPTAAQGVVASRTCTACLENFYGFGSAGGCIACGCHNLGSDSLQCNETGVCSCLETVGGDKCDSCLPGFFNLTDGGCSPCECSTAGSESSDCNTASGVCSCKMNVVGAKCDRCQSGFFNLAFLNPMGCQPCFCYGHADTCNVAPNYIQQFVNSDFTQDDANGWRSSDPYSLDINSANIRISHPPGLMGGESLYLIAPDEYLGFKLSSYGGTLSYQAKLDVGGVDLTNDRYLRMTGGPLNASIYYAAEEFVPQSDAAEFTATFYEGLWRMEESDGEISTLQFQEILAALTSIQIRASFGEGTVSTFYTVTMETASYIESPSDNDVVVMSVEQCVCDVSSNTMDLSCSQCLEGTKRQNPFGPPTDNCVPCFCNGRASSCDPSSGVCQGCQAGTVGDLCESCAAYVLEPNCGQCVPDYYGFGTDLFGGACSACNCNGTGTGGTTECENGSGQCPCVGNFGGRQCGGCAYNYYNYDLGCLKCNVCYDGIETAYLSLLELQEDLSSYVDALEASDNSSIPSPFHERIQATNAKLVQLIETTSATVQEGSNLETTVSALNSAIEALMSTLDIAIRNDIAFAAGNASLAESNARLALEAVDIVNAEITLAYEVLTSGYFQAAQSTLEELRDSLLLRSTQLGELSSQTATLVSALQQEVDGIHNVTEHTLETANEALQTAQRAQVTHDNTTARTAAEISRATDEINKLAQQTVEATASLLERAGELDSAARSKLAEVEAAGSAVDDGRIDSVMAEAGDKVREAGEVEDLANAQLTVAQSTINTLHSAQQQTENAKIEVDVTIAEVDARRNRSAEANQAAASSVTASNDAFQAAEEMLTIALDFENQASAAQTNAVSALAEVLAIDQEADDNLAQSAQLRVQFTPVAETASDALRIANEAFSLADTEAQAIKPINDRADELYTESANQLTDTDDVTRSASQLNENEIQPSLAACDAYQPAIETLEDTVTQASSAADAAAISVAASQARVSALRQSLMNIQQVDTSDLPALQTQIQQARELFSQEDYAAIVTALRLALGDQAAWLADTMATVTELQGQIDGLQSFSRSP